MINYTIKNIQIHEIPVGVLKLLTSLTKIHLHLISSVDLAERKLILDDFINIATELVSQEILLTLNLQQQIIFLECAMQYLASLDKNQFVNAEILLQNIIKQFTTSEHVLISFMLQILQFWWFYLYKENSQKITAYNETIERLHDFYRSMIKALEHDRKKLPPQDYLSLHSQMLRIFIDKKTPDGNVLDSFIQDLQFFAKQLDKNDKARYLRALLYPTKEYPEHGIIEILTKHKLEKKYSWAVKTLENIYYDEPLPMSEICSAKILDKPIDIIDFLHLRNSIRHHYKEKSGESIFLKLAQEFLHTLLIQAKVKSSSDLADYYITKLKKSFGVHNLVSTQSAIVRQVLTYIDYYQYDRANEFLHELLFRFPFDTSDNRGLPLKIQLSLLQHHFNQRQHSHPDSLSINQCYPNFYEWRYRKLQLETMRQTMPAYLQAKAPQERITFNKIGNHRDEILAAERYCSEQLRQITQGILQTCVILLGLPPEPFAIFGLGSLSLNCATPYSDAEYGLVRASDNSEYQSYFDNLLKLFHFNMELIGEAGWGYYLDMHPLTIFDSGIARLQGTPEKIASYLSLHSISDKLKLITKTPPENVNHALQTPRLLFSSEPETSIITGKQLFKKDCLTLIQKKQRELYALNESDTVPLAYPALKNVPWYQVRALSHLAVFLDNDSDLTDYNLLEKSRINKEVQDYFIKPLESKINLKKHLLKPLKYFILDLANFFFDENDRIASYKSVQEALAFLKPRLSIAFFNELENALLVITVLRYRAQAFYKKQYEVVYSSKAKIPENAYQLSEDEFDHLTTIYATVIQPTYLLLTLWDLSKLASKKENLQIIPNLNRYNKDTPWDLSTSIVATLLQKLRPIQAITEIKEYEKQLLDYCALVLTKDKLEDLFIGLANKHYRQYLLEKLQSFKKMNITNHPWTFLPDKWGESLARSEEEKNWEVMRYALTDEYIEENKQIYEFDKRIMVEWIENGKPLKRLLAVNIQNIYIHAGMFNPKFRHQDGKRLVIPIELQNNSIIYAKIYPEMPGIQLAADRLCYRLSGRNFQTTLCQFTPLGKNAIASYPVLLSPEISGISLQQWLRENESLKDIDENLDAFYFTLKVLETLVIYYEDDKPDNIIVEKYLNSSGRISYRLLTIDGDHAFLDALIERYLGYSITVQLKSIVFCFSQMQYALHPAAVKLFLTYDPHELPATWLKDLQVYYQASMGTKTNPGLLADKLKTWFEHKDSCIAPVIFEPGTIQEIYKRLRRIQAALSDMDDPVYTHFDLMRRLEPRLADYYERVHQLKYTTPEARFYALSLDTDYKTIEEPATKLVNYQSVLNKEARLKRSITITRIANKKDLKAAFENEAFWIPEYALKELKRIHSQYHEIETTMQKFSQRDLKNFFAADSYIQEEILKRVDFNNVLYTGDQSAQIKARQNFELTLLDIIQDKTKYQILTLRNCLALTNERLEKLLQQNQNLTELNVSGCIRLKENLGPIIEIRSNLEIINLSHTQIEWLTTRTGLGYLELPKLRRLLLNNCQKLLKVEINNDQMTHFEMHCSNFITLAGSFLASPHLYHVILNESKEYDFISKLLNRCPILLASQNFLLSQKHNDVCFQRLIMIFDEFTLDYRCLTPTHKIEIINAVIKIFQEFSIAQQKLNSIQHALVDKSKLDSNIEAVIEVIPLNRLNINIADLTNSDYKIRIKVLINFINLTRITAEDINAIKQALTKEKDPEVKTYIALALLIHADETEELNDILLKALDNKDAKVRALAASALGKLTKPAEKVIAALINAQDDADSYEVQDQAKNSLKNLAQTLQLRIDNLFGCFSNQLLQWKHALKNEIIENNLRIVSLSISQRNPTELSITKAQENITFFKLQKKYSHLNTLITDQNVLNYVI